MNEITNRKIAGLEPRWALFSGFSLLFDNPGSSLSQMDGPGQEGWLKIDCCVDENPELLLYKCFTDALGQIGENRLKNTYLFCPLPSSSYHVTVWDGLNHGNVQNVCTECRPMLEDLLNNLPRALLTDKMFINEVHDSPLLIQKDRFIKFKFDELVKLSNQALLARLKPADDSSKREIDRIAEERTRLSARFQKLYKVKMQIDYSPHVSLGYFANRAYAEQATSQIVSWTRIVCEKVGNATITFHRINLYGFIDMITFFRKRDP